MKLVFYSGGFAEENTKIDQELIKLLKKKNPVITFIPSSSFDAEVEFKEFVKHYSKYKINRFIFFPVDIPIQSIMETEVFKSDAIYLAGGNTFYFLNSLRKSKLLPKLKNFALNGGLLMGLSAGAIIMTKNIMMAGHPEFDRDENEVNIKNLSALNLVNFHFFPHFKNSKRYDEVLKKLTTDLKINIFACPDGSGIILKNNQMIHIGKCYHFHQGKRYTV
jgi:dipeptidase E